MKRRDFLTLLGVGGAATAVSTHRVYSFLWDNPLSQHERFMRALADSGGFLERAFHDPLFPDWDKPRRSFLESIPTMEPHIQKGPMASRQIGFKELTADESVAYYDTDSIFIDDTGRAKRLTGKDIEEFHAKMEAANPRSGDGHYHVKGPVVKGPMQIVREIRDMVEFNSLYGKMGRPG